MLNENARARCRDKLRDAYVLACNIWLQAEVTFSSILEMYIYLPQGTCFEASVDHSSNFGGE